MERVFYVLYKVVTGQRIGRILLGKTEFEVNRYLPFDSYGIGARTMAIFLKHIILSIFIFFVSFFLIAKSDRKYFFISFLAGISTYYNSIVSWKRKQEIRILRQLSEFLGELRHSYYRSEDVMEAFSEAFNLSGEELKLHLGLIEEALESGGIPDRYKLAPPSKYLLVLLSICECTIKYGDKDLLFISNLDELQKSIDSDLLKWDRENYSYHFLFPVLILPLVALPLIENWAIHQIEGLASLYNDYRGSLIRIIILVLSFPVFLFFIYTKDTENRGVNPLMDYILDCRIVQKFFRVFLRIREKKKKREFSLFDSYFPRVSYLQFILRRIFCFFLGLFSTIYWLWYWKQPSYLLIISLIIAIGTSYLPYLVLVIKGLYYESELEDEIGQVRLVMIALSSVSGMTALEMLLWVESLTTYLKASVSNCIDEMGTDEEGAFKKLRNKWRNTGFMILVDNLIASDKIGVFEAFKDLYSRREYYLARRRQDREFITRKKEAILNTFMFFPLMLSVFLYLILPFLYLGLTSLLETTKNLT